MTQPPPTQFHRFEALSLATALTVLAMVLPYSDPVRSLYRTHFAGHPWLLEHRFADLVLILMGLILVLPAPRASGLCIGRIRENWRRVLLLIGTLLLLTAIVYPFLED